MFYEIINLHFMNCKVYKGENTMKKIITWMAVLAVIAAGGLFAVNNVNCIKVNENTTVETEGFGSSNIKVNINSVEVNQNIDDYSGVSFINVDDGVLDGNNLNDKYKFVVVSVDIESKDAVDITLNCMKLGASRSGCNIEPSYSSIISTNEHDSFKASLDCEKSQSFKIGYFVKSATIDSGKLILEWNPNGLSFDDSIKYIKLDIQ